MSSIHGYRSTKNYSQKDDRTLIQQIGIGDPKAFSLLYDRHKTIAFFLAIAMTYIKGFTHRQIAEAMKSLRGKPRSISYLGFSSLLSQQAAGN